MKKSLSLLLICLSFSAFGVEEDATPLASSSSDLAVDPADFNPHKGHWLVNFNFEGMQYATDYTFAGEKKNFKPEDQTLIGIRMGMGREFYLGGGLMTSTRVEGFYNSKVFKRDLKADPDAPDIDFSQDKTTSQFMGVDAVQSLSMLFDMKTKNPLFDQWTYLTVEPFIEAGIGMAKAYNRRSYYYDTGAAHPTQIDEAYRKVTNDDLTNVKFGAGVHFTSKSGYFFTMRVTQNRYDLNKSKTKGFARYDNGTIEDLAGNNKTKLDPIMVYSIGGGVKF